MEKLFAGRSVYQHMTEQQVKVRTFVNSLTRQELEQSGTAAVVDALMARCAFAVPRLDEEGMLPPTVKERDPNGAEVTISVPFTGDRTLFFVRPSKVALRLDADVQPTALVFSYASPTRDAADVRAEVDRIISAIRSALAQLEADLHPFSGSLRADVQQAVERRHQALTAAHASAAGLAGGKKST